MGQHYVLDAHCRVLAHAADHGGHAAFGVAVEDRLRAVGTVEDVDRTYRSGGELELLGSPAELAHRVLHQLRRRRPAEPQAHGLGVAVADRNTIAMRREREAGVDEALPIPCAEELLRLLLHLLFFLGDERDDVVERVERCDAGIARAGDRLHRRDDRELDAERQLQGGGGEREADRRAIPVRHDRAGPATLTTLHVERVHVLGVHFRDEEWNVLIHAMRLHVREDVVPGLRERGLPLFGRVAGQRGEANLGVEIGRGRLQLHAGDRGRHLA